MRGQPLGVRYRRGIRELKQAPAPVPALALFVVALLLADIVGLGSLGRTSPTHHAVHVSSGGKGGAGAAAGSPGVSNVPGATLPGASSTPGKSGGPSGSATGPTAQPSGSGPASGGTSAATTSLGPGCPSTAAYRSPDRGVTPTSIKVVFPWPNLGPVGQATGISTSSEDPVMSINTYVNDINAHCGILGRRIDPEIVSYNPLDDSAMRADCLSWTQDQKVFAVVDTYAWHDDNQLCITQEGQTPLLSGWTSVPQWTQQGAPNLWWTAPDESRVVENVVAWAKSKGYVNGSTKLGVVAADRQTDTIALNTYLLPALQRAGIKVADVESMHFDQSDGADGAAQAPVDVTRFRTKGITTVLPLLPFTSFAAFLKTAEQQSYMPRYLLSDYESELSGGLALADAGFTSLQDMSGPTSFILGSHDDTRGYDAQGLDCYNVWMKANPGVTPPPDHWVEATGTAMTYCQDIRLFAAAARLAGSGLTRAGFDASMAKMTNFQGTVITSLVFGPGNYSGPHQVRTVAIHENGDGKCPLLYDHKAQGSCWLVQDNWQEMQKV